MTTTTVVTIPAMTNKPIRYGLCKQVLSADSVVIRGEVKGGPPEEQTVCLTNIVGPRLARRPNPNGNVAANPKDEPYAWQSREFVRRMCVGNYVTFVVEYKVPASGREYGWLYIGTGIGGDNVARLLVENGLVEVRRSGIRPNDEDGQVLCALEDAAKATKIGRWSECTNEIPVRDIVWELENPKNFVDSFRNKPIPGIIEYVRDGATLRMFLMPPTKGDELQKYYYITLLLSGLRCPMFRFEGGQQTGEDPYADEAKFCVESRLLQRDVQVILEGVSNPAGGSNGAHSVQNLVGTIVHPRGNISEVLLKEGFARCVDWSMGLVSQGPEKLRAAEKFAKEKRNRLWKDYQPPNADLNVSDKQFTAKVTEIMNGESVMVLVPNGDKKRIFLSSVKCARFEGTDEERKKIKPLYDIPFLFEAREYLRKKLVGKKVNVSVDYIQPANSGFPEKMYATLTIGDVNVAEALVSKGYSLVLRYRQDDDHRSVHYDELVSAESKARKNANGLHSKKADWPIHRIADVTSDPSKAKQFLPSLQRAGLNEAVVEFVVSGSRLKLYLPKETCLFTLLLSGISCPRLTRNMAGEQPLEPRAISLAETAHRFTKDLCLQLNVSVEVITLDRVGNFIGWLHVNGVNLAEALVEAGLASVHYAAERSKYFSQLEAAEARAKQKRIGIWERYVEEAPKEEIIEERRDRVTNYYKVVVTEIDDDFHFFAQPVDRGDELEKALAEFRSEMRANPSICLKTNVTDFFPKRGDLCACLYSDGLWYRVKVEKVTGKVANIIYTDFGNREIRDVSELYDLPEPFKQMPQVAREYALAYVKLPTGADAESINDAVSVFKHDSNRKYLLLNDEYVASGVQYATLACPDTQEDLGKQLVADGLVLVDVKGGKYFANIMAEYIQAQQTAKFQRRNLWKYGDFTQDEAREFGMGP